MMTDCPPSGRGQGHVTHFYIWGPRPYIGLQIENKEYCHYTLKFCSMGVHSVSRDLLKFWEISANILETVQDKDAVTMED